MCGIVGLITSGEIDLETTIRRMNATLRHRGPDDAGVAVLPGDGVALAMRRLSILDLESGHQPQWTEDGRCCVVFNGEIYNFMALRRELAACGHRFATDHSDTEVLVHGYEEWGTSMFPRLNGMFAVAIWDGRRKCLVVGRDRAGEKPLYVARLPHGYALASELKALLQLPELSRELDLVALEQYLSFDYVLGPRTMLAGVEKLPAGNVGTITSQRYQHEPYWTIRFHENGAPEPEALEKLDQVLDRSVASRMIADVPLGLFLSGGVDSSTIGYYMRRHSDDVHSFSIGFEEKTFDESRYAQLAAEHLGTHHHLEVFSQQRILDLVPRIAEILDEPMGDPSIFPTHLLSCFARGHVKVALGGDGSDELFMGYKAFRALKAAWSLDWIPLPARRGIASVARRLPHRVGPVPLRGVRFAGRLDRSTPERLLSHLGSFKGDARWILSPEVRMALPADVFAEPRDRLLDGRVSTGPSPANQSVAAYLSGYLQEDILVKVDRASMATSLEVRAPFLDPDLIELLLGVPASLKLRGMTGKYLLRQLMRGRLPDEILDRPKMGFGVPISCWLRDSLAPLVRERLSPAALAGSGVFDTAAVTRVVDEHLSGRGDRGLELWLLLQFELWRDRWLS